MKHSSIWWCHTVTAAVPFSKAPVLVLAYIQAISFQFHLINSGSKNENKQKKQLKKWTSLKHGSLPKLTPTLPTAYTRLIPLSRPTEKYIGNKHIYLFRKGNLKLQYAIIESQFPGC